MAKAAKKEMTSKTTSRYACMGPLLEFLKNMQVGSKKDMAEKEEEWERRRNWKGQDKLAEL